MALNTANAALVSRLASIVGSRYLYLVHDRQGRILLIVNPDNERFSMVVPELKELGSLARFYDFSLIRGNEPSVGLSQKTPFRWRPNPFEFFTILPESMLSTQRLEENAYLGRIVLIDLAPNISAANNIYTFIFSDTENDRLLGCTSDFHALFRESYPSPEKMLGLPLSTFLSPTPVEFQKNMAREPRGGALSRFTPLYEKDFSREGLSRLEETPLSGHFKSGEPGLEWENPDRPLAFITILREIDTRKQDFTVTLSFANRRGFGPYLTLGDRYFGEDRLPDNTGYFAGPSFDDGSKILLKRNGFTAALAPRPGGRAADTVVTLQKSGETLRLLENGAPLLSYYDSDFIHRSAAYLTLGLRKGYACLLKSVRILAGEAENPERPRRHIARLNNRQGSFFTLDRFYNQSLNAPEFAGTAGFLLNDITEMQDRIASLDRQVRLQVKNEEKLKNLLSQYQKEEREFIGSGGAMSVVKETARTVAESSATVLIEGETGTGKEVLARFIHDNSGRREGPFIKVDCSTIPSTLIESHLFGHEKGSFTGALTSSTGMLEKADNGTLFLDEAGNLTADAQAKLLQFLNDFTITRIGGATPLHLNVRCIVASNTRLEERVKAGLFREDLYYRINVVYLRLPPLKERVEDIPALCRHFLKQFNEETGKRIQGFSPQALKKLTEYGWPGNIRELRNVIHRAVIFCQDETLAADLLQFPQGAEKTGQAPGRKPRSPFYLSLTKKEEVAGALRRNFGHASKTAKELNIARATLYKFIKQHGLNAGDFRKGLGGS